MPGEAGIHSHNIPSGSKMTDTDGKHTHVFMIDGSKVESEMGGGHSHNVSDDYYGIWGGNHGHKVIVDGKEYMTDEYGGWHSHELLTGMTTESGTHRHSVMLDDGTVVHSMMPGDTAVAKSEDASDEETPERKQVALTDLEVAKRIHGKSESIWKNVIRR